MVVVFFANAGNMCSSNQFLVTAIDHLLVSEMYTAVMYSVIELMTLQLSQLAVLIILTTSTSFIVHMKQNARNAQNNSLYWKWKMIWYSLLILLLFNVLSTFLLIIKSPLENDSETNIQA